MVDLSYFEEFVSNSTIGYQDVKPSDINKCKDFVTYIIAPLNKEEKISVQIIILIMIAKRINTKNPSFTKFNKAFISHHELREWISNL